MTYNVFGGTLNPTLLLIIIIIIIISNYIKVRPKASRAGFVCRTTSLQVLTVHDGRENIHCVGFIIINLLSIVF